MIGSAWLGPVRRWLAGSPSMPSVRRHRRCFRPGPELLEDRTLFAITASGLPPSWVFQGPQPELANYVQSSAPSMDMVSGDIQSIAVNPNSILTDPGPPVQIVSAQVIVGTANGGVWEATNVNTLNPGAVSWKPLTDSLGSLSIGAVAFDTSDHSGKTFYAGTGLWSNGFTAGGPAVGLYKTADDGNTWSLLGSSVLSGHRIKSLLVSGSTILVGTIDGSGTRQFESRDYKDLGGKLFVSTDGGKNFHQAVGVKAGAVTSLLQDPGNPKVVYAAVTGLGVYRSNNLGADGSWMLLSTGPTSSFILANDTDVELTAQKIGTTTTLFAGVETDSTNTINGIFMSTNGGTSWTPLASPPIGGGAGFAEKFQLQADPTNSNVVYLDGQGGTGIFRYNPAGMGSWGQIDRGGTSSGTAPHADSHDLKFLGNSALLEADDGGIYSLTNPTNAGQSDWISLNTNLGITELASVAYDPVNGVIYGGAQDNSASHQLRTDRAITSRNEGMG